MERLTAEQIVAINKRIGEKGIQINNNIGTIIYKLDEENNFERYATRLVRDIIDLHPFLEGNKRTAFYSLMMFLKINGLELNKDFKYGGTSGKIDRMIKSVILERSFGRALIKTRHLLKILVHKYGN